ncbi:hypothetical protein PTKIN_Ptkin09bG0062800 [Pterospermum kingtungense]
MVFEFNEKPVVKLFLVFILFLCFMHVSYASPSRGAIDSNYDCGEFGSEIAFELEQIIVIIVVISFGVGVFITVLSFQGETFLMLQRYHQVLGVGLSAKARSLQRELTEIALTADGSTANGRNFILEETISSLLRHPNYYLYGYSSVTRWWTTGSAEQCFKRLSKEELLKFEVESLVNINNNKRQRAIVPKADKIDKDCIVVTVLVAAQGAHNLPTVRTTDDVKEALQSLTKIRSSKIKAVEALWSPQDETDSLSVEELLENYPQLRRI